MKGSIKLPVFTILCMLPHLAWSGEPSTITRISARALSRPEIAYDLEKRSLEHLLTDRVVYELAIQRVESELTLAKAHRDAVRRVTEPYQSRFQRYDRPSQTQILREQAKLDLLAIDLAIKDLEMRRDVLKRQRRAMARLHQLRVRNANIQRARQDPGTIHLGQPDSENASPRLISVGSRLAQ